MIRKYKKFHLIQEEYSSDKNIAKALNTDMETFNLVANNPKYRSLLNKVKTLTTNGLAALMRTIGTEIKKDANLVSLSRLRKKLDKLKSELSETLEKWYKTHANLDRTLEGEKKRLELQDMLLEKVGVDRAKDLDIDIIGKQEYIVELIKKKNKIKQIEEKIKTASLDKVVYFVKDKTIFTPLDKKIKDIVKAENTRYEFLDYLKDGYAEGEALKVNQNSNQLEEIKEAMKNSRIYQEFIDELHKANTDEILTMDEAKLFKYYNKKLAVIGYRYINKIKIDEALAPYLALKPKGVSNEKYLKALKKSSFYEKALRDTNSENLAIQRNFDPNNYFNYKSEVGAKSKNTLYNYAVTIADSLPAVPNTGTVASNHENESST